MSTVEIVNGEDQIAIVPELDDTVVVIASTDITTAIESGEQGPPGAPGPPGVPSYIPGPPGTDGNTILYGAADPDSSVGANGNFYINTTTHFLFGPKAGTTWPPGTSLIGPTGAPGATGAPGNTILYGASDPVAGTGVDGNFYINTTTHFIFGPKAGGAWPAGVSLIGPQGPQGIPGTPGAGAPATVPPLMDGTAAVGTSTLFARQDHIHPSDTSRLAKGGDTMTGALTLAADPAAPLQPATKQYVDARYQRVALGGVNSFDVQVPAGKVAARLIGTVYPSTGNATYPLLQLSVASGVFRNTAGDYSLDGMTHISTTNAINALTVVASVAGALLASSHSNAALPMTFTTTVVLKRTGTGVVITCDSQSSSWSAGACIHSLLHNYLTGAAAGGALSILAFRLINGASAEVWGGESYVNIEWF